MARNMREIHRECYILMDVHTYGHFHVVLLICYTAYEKEQQSCNCQILLLATILPENVGTLKEHYLLPNMQFSVCIPCAHIALQLPPGQLCSCLPFLTSHKI